MKAKLYVSPAHTVGKTDKNLFGSFIEHIGRAVYSGIYEPGHPSSDEYGFRKDVADAIKEMNVPLIRYPGGNFVSGYDWRDGIGPKESRPMRTDLAWKSLEPNQCGTDDFAQFCERIGSEVLMTVNLGTGGASDARDLVEYCNLPGGTYYSDLRKKNGREAPYGIKYWCLGNEMDGDWQIGHKEAHEYARLAAEASKMMKWVDPTIKTVICGSSAPEVPTYGDWEQEVLRTAYDHIDYISLHRYCTYRGLTMADYLACPLNVEEYINGVIATCDAEKSRRHSRKTIMLSFDEWNVWNHTADKAEKDWMIAPPILEEFYTLQDAVVVGGWLITLLRHCDRIKIACLAQLVNVIAPIMTVKGGGIWKQTIFYPFADASNHGQGTVFDVRIDSETYNSRFGEAKFIDSIVVNNEKGETVVFAVNRSTDSDADFSADLTGISNGKNAVHTALFGTDPLVHNSADEPDKITPSRIDGVSFTDSKLECKLPPLSWNMIVIS